jgi:hypothetical protein
MKGWRWRVIRGEKRFAPPISKSCNFVAVGQLSRRAHYRHKRPIASHFHSVALEIFYLGEDLDEADG